MNNLRNISLSDYRRILAEFGCEFKRSKGDHEVWWKDGMKRPIIFHTHIEVIPEPIVRNTIRDLEITHEEFLRIFKKI